MNGKNQKVDVNAVPVREGGNHSDVPGCDETITKADGACKTSLGRKPTMAAALITADEIKRLIQEHPEEELIQHIQRFSEEKIESCCIVDPTFALLFCRDFLSKDQLEYCINKDPQTALVYAKSSLTEAQIHNCYRLDPESALLTGAMNLDAELRDYCVRAAPDFALRQAFSSNPSLKLSAEQYEYCFSKAPLQALKHPAKALKAAADRMEENLFVQCALAEPGMALWHAAGRLSNSLVKKFIRTHVWAVLMWAPDHLTDRQVLHLYTRKPSRIRQLLGIQPNHPLAIRLLPLCDQLDPLTVEAVTHAISSGI